ncbi:hypothetical protein BG74_03750 [Sodalis-like endosymbiont of Proechinophthirus fluctus]|nr:hypothetical protein BG74_03750 [Sodalis-like endosymbiont of Proechinophthirus fluctus]
MYLKEGVWAANVAKRFIPSRANLNLRAGQDVTGILPVTGISCKQRILNIHPIIRIFYANMVMALIGIARCCFSTDRGYK